MALLLLSNDDGVYAKGIKTFRQALMNAGHEVYTVAPLLEQSGKSHSFTLSTPLRHTIVDENTHAIDGTPADCTYIALNSTDFLPRTPDLVVSGINHGFNLGSDTFYSGTVAAAREAAFKGVPAIAFSQEYHADFDRSATVAVQVVDLALKNLPLFSFAPLINVNIPKSKDMPKGYRVTRLGKRKYNDDVMIRKDPRGREYIWLGGTPFAHNERTPDSDTLAIEEGYVSVTPLSLDLSKYDALSDLKTIFGASSQ